MKKINMALSASLLLSSLAFSSETTDIEMLKAEIKELKGITQTLIDETSDLKTGFSYTTVDTKKSHSGLSPAASKVYYSKSPLSIGGYGEMYYARTTKDNDDTSSIVDVYRFVPYIGYKFTDNIVLNTELEFEHGGVDHNGNGGEVIVEFMYLDFSIHKNFNLRVGNMLMPMGLINERHEPTLFTTVQRPKTAKYLIPSTWHESGIMAYGEIVDNLSYKVAGVTALKPTDGGDKWIRSGRGGGFKNKDPKLGVIARVDYSGIKGLVGGLSVYNDSDMLMADVHFDYHLDALRVYGVYTQITRSDAGSYLNDDGESKSQVEVANGGYLNLSYNIASLVSLSDKLPLFVQYETINPQAEYADGSSGDATTFTTFGLNYFPHPQVVLKTDYVLATKDSKTDSTFSLSMGFIF